MGIQEDHVRLAALKKAAESLTSNVADYFGPGPSSRDRYGAFGGAFGVSETRHYHDKDVVVACDLYPWTDDCYRVNYRATVYPHVHRNPPNTAERTASGYFVRSGEEWEFTDHKTPTVRAAESSMRAFKALQ